MTTQQPPTDNPPPPSTEPTVGLRSTRWQLAGRVLQEMELVELKNFGDDYGFSIMPTLKRTKKYADMLPGEKAEFEAYHKLNVGK